MPQGMCAKERPRADAHNARIYLMLNDARLERLLQLNPCQDHSCLKLHDALL